MRVNVLNNNGRLMLRSAAIILAGVSAGCSSGSMRFTDDLFTGTTQNQQAIIPSTQQASAAGRQAAPLDAAPTGAVSRSAMAPVSVSGGQSSLAPLSPAAGEAPVQTRTAVLAPQAPRVPAQNAVAVSGPTVTLQPGETLNGLAHRYGISRAAIIEANGISDPNAIRAGQRLILPGASAAALAAAPKAPANAAQTLQAAIVPSQPKTTGEKPSAAQAQAPAKTEPAVASAKTETAPVQPAAYTPPKQSAREVVDEASTEEAPGGTGIGKMRWPVRGRVIAGYGAGSGKAGDGIDISVPEGTSVKAAENGVVIYAGDGLKEFGNTVLVRHENGLVTVYGHASALKVQRGQTVKRGQEVALSGASGTTEAPKLHFEVRKNSAPVDPKTFLE